MFSVILPLISLVVILGNLPKISTGILLSKSTIFYLKFVWDLIPTWIPSRDSVQLLFQSFSYVPEIALRHCSVIFSENNKKV